MASNINLNNTIPAPPSNQQNVQWQFDASSPANVSAHDPAFVGDSGSGGKAGNVPAPAAGDGTSKFLKADGTWTALGSAAFQSTSAFDAAGSAANAQATSLQKSQNLADLASAATARANLGLVASATTDTTNAGNITSGTLPNARLSAVPNAALANSSVTVSAGAGLAGGGSVALGGNTSLSRSDAARHADWDLLRNLR